MLPIQILLLLFFAIAVVKVVSKEKAGDLSFRGALAWIIFWMVAGVVVVMPDSTFYVAKLFGVGRGADIVVYIALAGLFFLAFRIMVKIEKLNRELTKVVRDNALREKDRL